MPNVFGKDIAYTFYALDGDGEPQALPTAPEAIYLYKVNYKPSREQAAAGTNNGGLIGDPITTWSDSGQGKTFTIGAIDDPDPTGADRKHTYWLAINFKFAAAEQTQTVLRALPMQRAYGAHEAISTTLADLEGLFPQVDEYWNDTQQDTAIGLASDIIRAEFDAAGFEWVSIWRPDKLNIAVAYRALAVLAAGELAAGNAERWQALHDLWMNSGKTSANTLKLEYDRYDADEPTNIETKNNYIRIMR